MCAKERVDVFREKLHGCRAVLRPICVITHTDIIVCSCHGNNTCKDNQRYLKKEKTNVENRLMDWEILFLKL